MKKIVLFVATIVAVSLASCGGNKANNEESTKAAQNLKDSVAAVAAAADKAVEVKDAAKQAGEELKQAAKDKAEEVTNAAKDKAIQAIDDAANAAKKQLGENK